MSLRGVLLVTAVALLATGCITAPPPDTPAPPVVQVDSADVRARQFGSTTTEIITNPASIGLTPIPSNLGSKPRRMHSER